MKIKLLPRTKTLQLHDHGLSISISVPRSVIRKITELHQAEVPEDDLVAAVAKGEWAQELARAFCLPSDRRFLPWNELTDMEKTCIDVTSTRLAKRIVRAF